MPLIQESSSSPPSKRTSSEERVQKIRVKNRRKLYLDRHPSYFTSPDLELADPLLYDRCIRRFQSAAEREADGKAKGYSGVLEADILRSEAKIAALHQNDPTHISQSPISSTSQTTASNNISYIRSKDGDIVPEEEDEVPKSKEEGWERWRYQIELRFLRGEDLDFDYKEVDEMEEWDEIEGREEEERWFEDEEPEWARSSSEERENPGDENSGKGKKGTGGETGIQDF